MATILDIIEGDQNLTLFCKGLRACGLETRLAEPGPFTILGPVNLALAKLTNVSFDQLMQPKNKFKLVEFLSSYILTGKQMLSDFRDNRRFPTLDGTMVTAQQNNGDVRINGSKILSRDRQGSNGVVHLLDTTFKN